MNQLSPGMMKFRIFRLMRFLTMDIFQRDERTLKDCYVS